MRGAPRAVCAWALAGRIIPTDAGSTMCMPGPHPYGRDHPRGCGEHEISLPHLLHAQGSSPRMRGAQSLERSLRLAHRIIPADAGSTPTPCLDTGYYADHPRGCGEHALPGTGLTRTSGSSPRMRGAQQRMQYPAIAFHIIPADAGSTEGCGS